jgi:hypothetical protein
MSPEPPPLAGVTFTNATGINVTSTALSVLGTGSFLNATASTLQANFASFASATVAGQGICLANGVGCPSTAAGLDTLQSVTARGSFTTTTAQFFGGLTTSNLTATGTTSLQNTTITNATSSFLAVSSFVNSNLLPASDLAYTLGNATNRWNATFGNTTSTNATSTNLFATNLNATNGTIQTLASQRSRLPR